MNCEHLRRMLDAWVDGELDEATQRQVQSHLAGCPACDALRADREALRHGLRRLPRAEPSAHLRHRIDSALAAEARKGTAPLRVAWWPTFAAAGVAASLAFVLGLWVGAPAPVHEPHDLREQAVGRHVASFEGGVPRVEVVSSDRHVVKPWFAGRLDFAPPVRDLAELGFTLVGGRVDELASRPAAALVYRIRRHQLTLFVARAAPAASNPVMVSTWRGFATATWAAEGLSYLAVSDTDPREMQRFAESMRSQAP